MEKFREGGKKFKIALQAEGTKNNKVLIMSGNFQCMKETSFSSEHQRNTRASKFSRPSDVLKRQDKRQYWKKKEKKPSLIFCLRHEQCIKAPSFSTNV